MYPIVYTQTDLSKKKAFRIAVVTDLGKFEEHSNFGVYDVETSEEYPNNKGRFDSEKPPEVCLLLAPRVHLPNLKN